MNAMDFEYAIKKDVRNNPIVREVDEARQRALLRSTVIGGLLVVVVLCSRRGRSSSWCSHGYAMETLQRQRAAEEEVNRHLRLEIETLRSPRRIEELATRKLHLVQPPRRPGDRHRARDARPRRRRSRSSPRASASASGGLVAEQQGRTFRLPWLRRAPRPAAARRLAHDLRRGSSSAPCCSACGRSASKRGWSTCRSSSTARFMTRAPTASRCAPSTAPAKRGEILDRTGRVLAYSVDADSVFADPSEIDDPDARRRGGVRRARRVRRRRPPGDGEEAARQRPVHLPCSARSRPTKSSGSASSS